MTLADVLQFLHVVSAFMFVTGIVGRDIVLGRARRAGDVEKVRDLVETAGPFERFFAIPGSFLVLLFGILTWWAEDVPVWGEGTRWVTVSLIVFLTNLPLIPLIFIPRGKVFRRARVGSAERTDHVRAVSSPSRPGRRDGTLVGGRNDDRRPPVDGDETVLTNPFTSQHRTSI